MVVVKSEDADLLLAKAAPEIAVVLLFGVDDGLIAERARLALKGMGADVNDPFQLARLEGADIASDPGRLLDETNTVSLFGASRIIWIDAGSADISSGLEMAFDQPRRDVKIVIEAGALKKDAPLRRYCERQKFALSIECNQDSEGDLVRLLDAALKSAGIGIDADARDAVLQNIGADRLSTRGEIGKLVTFAHGMKKLTLEDVESILSDSSSVALERTVCCAFSGDLAGVEESWKRVLAAGHDGSAALMGSIREASALHQYFSDSERGHPSEFARQRYGRGFGRKPLSDEALRKWSLTKAVRALEIVGEAARRARLDQRLAAELAIRALWSVSFLAWN